MFNYKKVIATMTAGAMLLTPMTAMAASNELANGGTTGDMGSEINNAELPGYAHVVLPTTTNLTYAVTFDGSKLSNKTDPVNFNAADTAFFTAPDDAATLAVDAATADYSTDDKLYLASYTATALTADSFGVAANVVLKADGTVDTVVPGYYLWVPDTSTDDLVKEGAGKYVELTAANYSTYFTYVQDGTTNTEIEAGSVDFMPVSASAGCDGKIYQVTYAEESADFASGAIDVAQYVTVTAGAVTEVKDVFVLTATGPNVYSEIGTTASALDELVYTPATSVLQGTSEQVTIVNKSSYPATVALDITLAGSKGMKFGDSATAATDLKMMASMLMTTSFAKTDGNAASADTKMLQGDGTDFFTSVDADNKPVDAKLQVVANLAAPATTNILYRSDAVDTTKGRYNYFYYLQPEVVYETMTFDFTAAAYWNVDAADATKDNTNEWLAYDKSIIARPLVNVVYTIKKNIPSDITFTLNSIGSIQLNTADKVNYPLKNDRAGLNVKVYNTAFPAGSTLAAAGVTLAAGGAADEQLTLNLNSYWATEGWSKIELTGVAVGGKTITIEKTGDPKLATGTVTVSTD